MNKQNTALLKACKMIGVVGPFAPFNDVLRVFFLTAKA